MTLRRHVGIAFALAVGMALGYAVRPSAQSTASSVLVGSPAEASLRLFVESAGPDQVRIRFSRGQTEFLEDRQIELSLVPEFLVVRGTHDMATKLRSTSLEDLKSGAASLQAFARWSDATGSQLRKYSSCLRGRRTYRSSNGNHG